YSVTFTGSAPVTSSSTDPSTNSIINMWNRGACRGWTILPQDQPKYCAMAYPLDRQVSSAAPDTAAKMPTSTNPRPTTPSWVATGSTTWPRVSTRTPCGRSTIAAAVATDNDSSPPGGKPTQVLIRTVVRSLRVQPSSTPPEEKKNTSYGVIAAPNSATA